MEVNNRNESGSMKKIEKQSSNTCFTILKS